MGTPLTGVERIGMERVRHVDEEGYTPAHDAEHDDMALLRAADAYLCAVRHPLVHGPGYYTPAVWPWGEASWKPSDPVRNLVKAGSLIAAEIDRLLALRDGEVA